MRGGVARLFRRRRGGFLKKLCVGLVCVGCVDYVCPMSSKINHGSLFSGIGGFDLAAEWMGWNNVFQCEWEEFPRRVLKHHFPNTELHGDIKEFSATHHHGRIDVLTGGFPCQPYSAAGKRLGKNDERHLWPEMLRIVRECAPRYVVGENVRGLVSWNGGLVFDEVCSHLEALGYSVQSFIIPACAVNAPHRRDRIWFVANANGGDARPDQGTNGSQEREIRGQETGDVFGTHGRDGDVADTERVRLEHGTESGNLRSVQREKESGRNQRANAVEANGAERDVADTNDVPAKHTIQAGRDVLTSSLGENGVVADTDGAGGGQNHGQGKPRFLDQARTGWEGFPSEPPVCGGNDGIPDGLDGITFSKWRRESIKGFGNAIVPQVALRIFQAIQQFENEHA